MGMIHSFRKLAYAQVVLGVIAYAVAEQNAAMVLAVGTLGTLSWYIVEGPGGRPLPRWFINLGVLTATGWMFYAQVIIRQPLIIGLGQFIVCLTLFKLYERKGNRDWSQLLVLSLMQMVCASIISAEVVYGVLLAVYMLLTLVTLLQFQLKRGYDEVLEETTRQAPPQVRATRPKPIVSRGHRRHFNALALTSGVGCLGLAACVFVLFPRGQGAGLLGDWDTPVQRSVSGFTRKVELAGGTTVATSRLPVMNLSLEVEGKDVGREGLSLLLRGLALDVYDPKTRRWTRSVSASAADHNVALPDNGVAPLVEPMPRVPTMAQRITMRSQTDGVMFAAYPPIAVAAAPGPMLAFNPRDQVLMVRSGAPKSVQYQVLTPYSGGGPSVGGGPWASVKGLESAYLRRWREGMHVPAGAERPRPFDWSRYARGPILDDPRIEAFTRRLILSPRLIERDPKAESTRQDHRIAELVEQYLQSHFVYTLDLPPIPDGADPIQGFLFTHQAGHCEYFASAMTAMLRSVGIRARVISGFRATEYNSVGGYYVVRQKNAHAWVEVWQDEEGWRPFDPSPPGVIERLHEPEGGVLAWLRDIYEYVEFQWINNVITFDDTQRRSVMVSLDANLDAIGERLKAGWATLIEWGRDFHSRWLLGPWGYLLLGFILAMISLGVFLLGQTLLRRHRHIRQLQLEQVGRRHKRRLARQLEFYIEMLRVVERAGHAKPVWQTPASFAEHLTHRDPQRFGDVVPLTDLFYEIRFGDRPLDGERARLVHEHLENLRALLRTPGPAARSPAPA